MFGFVKVNKSNTDQIYKVIFEQIPNAFARPAQGSEAPTCHSQKLSVFDGVNKTKCLGDMVHKLVSCLPSNM